MEAFQRFVAEMIEEAIHNACEPDESDATTTTTNMTPANTTTTTLTDAMETATQKNEFKQAESKEVQMATRETIFYVQFPEIYPIFMKQPSGFTKGKVIIHCVRHAEAQHNIVKDPNRWNIIDPNLTPLGAKQAIKLRANFTPMPNITNILASPLRRTMATALHAFEPLLAQGLKVVAYPDLREIGSGKASTGSSVEVLQKTYPEQEQLTDLRLVPQGWEYNKEDSKGENRVRASRVRRDLWELGQAALKKRGAFWRGHDVSRGLTHENIEIVIVTHGSFMQHLLCTKDVFWNAEYRSFEFEVNDIDRGEPWRERYKFIETEESKRRVHNHYRISPPLKREGVKTLDDKGVFKFP